MKKLKLLPLASACFAVLLFIVLISKPKEAKAVSYEHCEKVKAWRLANNPFDLATQPLLHQYFIEQVEMSYESCMNEPDPTDNPVQMINQEFFK